MARICQTLKTIKKNWELIFISLAILFIELLVIRLIGTEIRVFAYLSNLLLLAAFIGLGLGMLVKKQLSLLISGFAIFTAVVITSSKYVLHLPNSDIRLFAQITELLAPLSEPYSWQTLTSNLTIEIFLGLVVLLLIFLNVVLIFMPLGQRLGTILAKHNEPILAYSFNLIASIAGLWLFQAYSVSYLTPYLAAVLTLAALFFLVKNSSERLTIALLTAVLIVFVTPKSLSENIKDTYWSAYHKITIAKTEKDTVRVNPQPEGWFMEVNNAAYMTLLDLSENYKKEAGIKLDGLYGQNVPVNTTFSDVYYLPFQFQRQPKNVLIIGAGAGNDVAAALRKNVQMVKHNQKEMHIDAVEIDPTIISLGKKYHPENPYLQENANIIIGDGRSYLARTDTKYDLVVMGIADSYTPTSSLTNLRLDHYLYTKESFQRIKDVLRDDGFLFLTFEVRRPWVGGRLEKGLSEVFGQKPRIFEVRSDNIYGWGGYSFVVSKNPNGLVNLFAQDEQLNAYVKVNERTFSTDTKLLTDDWPYLYLDKPRLPLLHAVVGTVLLISLFIFKKTVIAKNKINLPMFFWGAAFLLFEFQNVSKSSLLFGVTWATNLFTISAILVLLLLANWTVQRKFVKPDTAFTFLLITAFVQIITPLSLLNTFSTLQKILFATLLLNLPLYFGGIIFAHMFKEAKDKASAFGSNFLGAVIGGSLEMTSFLYGIHSLLYMVILLYTLGYILYKQRTFNTLAFKH